MTFLPEVVASRQLAATRGPSGRGAALQEAVRDARHAPPKLPRRGVHGALGQPGRSRRGQARRRTSQTHPAPASAAPSPLLSRTGSTPATAFASPRRCRFRTDPATGPCAPACSLIPSRTDAWPGTGRNPSRVSRLQRVKPEASTATVSRLPTTYAWSKRFSGLHSLLVSPSTGSLSNGLENAALVLAAWRDVS